jgi:hypothetical protein
MSTFRMAMNALSRHATGAGGATLVHTIARTAVSEAAGRPSEDSARHIHGRSAANGLIAPAAGRVTLARFSTLFSALASGAARRPHQRANACSRLAEQMSDT